MLDAKDIDNLAVTLRQQREQLQVQEVARGLAAQFFLAAGNDATEDFRWRVIATMVGEVAVREAGLPEPAAGVQAGGSSRPKRKWPWWT
jgi:hypothetical protein